MKGDSFLWIPFILALMFLTAWLTPTRDKSGTDCYLDWDGRSNSTVCD